MQSCRPIPPGRLPALLGLVVVIALFGTAGEAEAHPKASDSETGDVEAVTTVAAPLPAPSLWGCPMCETVRTDAAGTCPICKMDLVPMRAMEEEQEEEERAAPAEAGPAGARPSHTPLMPGLPDGLFFGSVVFVLLLSFVLFEWWGRRLRVRGEKRGARWDLFRIPGLRRLMQRPWFLPAVQLPVFFLFVLVIVAGLFGNQNAERNIAPVLTWTVWWTWLVIAILFLGKAWCTVCPFMAIGDWLNAWRRRRGEPPLSSRKWPRTLRNIWLATVMFVGLTWLELGFGVTDKPRLTATLGLFMVAASLLTLLFFERKAFCRYACLVGRVSGLYSTLAMTELRASDPGVCRTCRTKDCFRGNPEGDPCPTHQFMGSMDRNTYCTLCTECVRTCSKQNISWNVRPPAADLLELKRSRTDEAWLAVILLSMSAFHGLTMTPSWDVFVAGIESVAPVGPLAAFTLGMATVLAVPLILYYAICWMMKTFSGDCDNGVRTLFVRFSYSLLPIALCYHLAHNLQHIFHEGLKLVRVASDPLGRGWDLFGTAAMPIDAVLPADVGWWIQVALILIGHIYGILIAHRTAFALYGSPRAATLSQVPMLAAMVLFSVQSLWLLAQPMVMRTAM